MAKVLQSPLVGFNNNVRHKARVFHIQTEDSGIKHPHIITHLFMDGGRILKSVKRSYAEHVGVDGMSDVVRQMMKEQHKAMFIALKDGQFDELVDQHVAAQKAPATPASAPAAPVPPPAPSSATSLLEAARKSERPAPEPLAISPANPAVTTNAPIPMASPLAPPMGTPPPPAAHTHAAAVGPLVLGARTEFDSSLLEAAAAAARAHLAGAPPSEGPRTMRDPQAESAAMDELGPIPQGNELPPMRKKQSSVVDLATLEQAAEDPGTPPPPSSPFFNASDLPPPPKNLFREKISTGEYRNHADDALRRVQAAGISVPTNAPPPLPPPRPPMGSRPSLPPRFSSPPREAREAAAATPAAPPARTPAPVPPVAPAMSVGAPVTTGTTGATGPKPTPTLSGMGSGRYAPARPASIFTTPPRAKLGSVVDDEQGTDRTLDEVILSYLAEDLEPPER